MKFYFKTDMKKFKSMLTDVGTLLSNSEFPSDAEAVPCWLRPDHEYLWLSASIKGIEVSSCVRLTGPVEPDERNAIPIMLGTLSRISTSAAEIEGRSDGKKLTLSSGRFKAEVSLANAKQLDSKTRNFLVTHEVPARSLLNAIDLVDFNSVLDGRAHVKLCFTSDTCSLWAHNDWHGAFATVCKGNFTPAEYVVSSRLVRKICQVASGNVTLSRTDRVWTAFADNVKVIHPERDLEISNIPEAFEAAALDEVPQVVCSASDLSDALASASSVDSENSQTKTSALDLKFSKDDSSVQVSCKTRLGSAQQFCTASSVSAEADCRVNYKALLGFLKRLKKRDVTVRLHQDRMVLDSGEVKYMVALVQKDDLGD